MHSLNVYITKLTSHLAGALADIPIPRILRLPILRTFATVIGADTSEAELSIENYRSCGDFFVRALRQGIRPLANASVISPVDGLLRSISPARQPIPQIKDINYTLGELFQDQSAASMYAAGSVAVFYLAPNNYHRIHAPFDCEIESVRLIPGALWPVNSWGLKNIPKLFCQNERLVLEGRTATGKISLVLVGATNVGRMELTFASVSSLKEAGFSIRGAWKLVAGQELGRFRLGSTVVLVTNFNLPALEQPRSVRYGESIL